MQSSTPRRTVARSASGSIRACSPLRSATLESVCSTPSPPSFAWKANTPPWWKLLQRDYISRSEAKRLVANLEKFREIVLDFRDVKSVGQGFADEVFRIFAQRHPAIKIATEDTNPVVAAMIRHARSL